MLAENVPNHLRLKKKKFLRQCRSKIDFLSTHNLVCRTWVESLGLQRLSENNELYAFLLFDPRRYSCCTCTCMTVCRITLCPKNIPDIFDCDLKTNYQILIIFSTNIPDTTCHQMTFQFPTSLIVLFLHCLENTQPAKYHFSIRCDMIA